METSSNEKVDRTNLSLSIGKSKLDLNTPVVMGILNITPDSFYDGGKYKNERTVLNQVEKMVMEGAKFIDIGAMSTRPGALDISMDEELKRILPVLKLIVKRFPGVYISIDTYRSEIARIALNSGAHVINDISGGRFDERMFEIIAKYKVPYVLMHIKGTPQNMQMNPEYENVYSDIDDFFSVQLNKLAALGVTTNIVLDPGFGFGKKTEHNFGLLAKLGLFKIHGFPILAGLSRKSMINKVLSVNPVEALNGTTVVNTIALLNGANILRVHDVKQAMEAIVLYKAYKLYK